MNDDLIDVVGLTANIVSAYVAHNPVPVGEMTGLISSVNQAIAKLNTPAPEKPMELIPAVAIRKSVTSDHIISLEDGRPYKSLKRHLTALGMTPDEYRAKWGLRSDYPMVAESYSRARSALAKSFGLGTRLAGSSSVRPSAKTAGPAKRQGRQRKAI